MLRPIDSNRLKHIYKLLLKVAQGDFSFEINRTNEDDEIEAILILVNLLVDEMKETLRYYYVLNSSESYKQYVNMLFILDSTFQIQFVNPQVHQNLGIKTAKLIGSSFYSLLSEKSLQNWKNITHKMLFQPEYQTISKLTFVCQNQLSKTLTTAINVIPRRVHSNPIIIITTFETMLKSQLAEESIKQSFQPSKNKTAKKTKSIVKEQDILIIQQIKDHILQNLEHPLPTLRMLANQFGTNEYKLKCGFKQLYNITVFRFLTRERLKKASLLIQNTTLPIKTVAKMTGFKNISHFSKAFKNQFDINPTDLKKRKE